MPEVGEIWLDPMTGTTHIWTGGQWMAITSNAITYPSYDNNTYTTTTTGGYITSGSYINIAPQTLKFDWDPNGWKLTTEPEPVDETPSDDEVAEAIRSIREAGAA